MIRGPVTARLGDHHIDYTIHLGAGILISAAYVAAACGASVLTGYRHVAVFGMINVLAVAVIAYLAIDGFASLWCGWAVVTSIAIAWHPAEPARRIPLPRSSPDRDDAVQARVSRNRILLRPM
jgi:hypothetical protein